MMSIHIVVMSVEGPKRIRGLDDLAGAVQVAAVLHRRTGREVQVVETDAAGRETCRLCLDSIALPRPPFFEPPG